MKYIRRFKIDRIRTLLLLFFSVTMCVAILVMREACGYGVKKGINICVNVLVPSLFPFLFVSSFIVKSGLSSKLGGLLDPITRILFNLPGCCAPTIILGLIGGYPSGARSIKELLDNKQISDAEAEQMLSFVVGAGPPFVITAIGCTLLKNKAAGIVLFVSQVISAILTGILSKFFFSANNTIQTNAPHKNAKTSLTDAVVGSVISSTDSMINMCAFVVIFSCLLSLINQSSIFLIIKSKLVDLGVSGDICECIIPMLLEVTSGAYALIEHRMAISFLAFTLAFAGVCVHLQIFSLLSCLKFSKFKFVLFRLVHGALAVIITNLIFKFIPMENAVISNISSSLNAANSSAYYEIILLIVLCICFLISITPYKLNKDNVS